MKWKIDRSKGLPLAVIEDTEDGYGVAEIDILHENSGDNAQLIATAPELLEALKNCIVDAKQDLSKKERLERIEYAEIIINKAI